MYLINSLFKKKLQIYQMIINIYDNYKIQYLNLKMRLKVKNY